jgi:hypothetical protein
MGRARCGALAVAFVVSLRSAVAWAEVMLQLGMPGNLGTTASYLHSDPIALAYTLAWLAGNQYLSSASTAAAAADLTAGTLRIYTVSRAIMATASGPPSTPQAQAYLHDSITIAGPGSSVLVTLTMDVGGYMSSVLPDPSVAEVIQNAGAGVSFLAPNKKALGVTITHTWYKIPPDGGAQDTTSVYPSSDAGNVTVTPTGVTITIQETEPVGQEVQLNANLITDATDVLQGVTETYDFGSTARLSLQLPAGYTFTSQSGVFLARAGDNGLTLDGGNYPTAFLDGGTSGGGTTGGTSGGGTTGGNGGTGGTSSSTGTHSGGCASSGSEPDGIAIVVSFLVALSFRSRARRRGASTPN